VTLNITVATNRCIYQCADYRLLDLRTGRTFDFETQKIIFVHTSRWSATVCFAGVGRTATIDVSQWLAERAAAISSMDPFDRLLDELLKADKWLSTAPAPYNRHSFSVGAFVGSDPVFALVSNFEVPSGLALDTPSARLSLYQERPSKPVTFVSGQKTALSRAARRRLAAFAARNPQPANMYSALAQANREAARHSRHISPACFTAHVTNTGEGGGRPHGTGDRQLPSAFPTASAIRDRLADFLDSHFGAGRHRVVQFTAARSEPTDDYHQTQLREKPNDPDSHSNFGAFLMDHKKDIEGAERAYRRALELNPDHINALGNLANLVAHRGEHGQAAELYRKALRTPGPGHENAAWNYANFLLVQFKDRATAIQVLEHGVAANPDSGRLILLRAEQLLLDGRVPEALQGLERAREKGAEEARVESCYACAVHMNGAPVGECIAAYRSAIALSPTNGALRLNLAQLLFLKAEEQEANALLREALKMGIDSSAQLEAQLYFLCHTEADPSAIAHATKELLKGGARLQWDVRPNIAIVRDRDPRRAMLAESFLEVMQGYKDPEQLDRAVSLHAR
jgi:tetratricopeptide (TPR) repeat protein